MVFSLIHYPKVDEETATIFLKHPTGKEAEPPKSFIFDHVFGFESSQLDIYSKVARPVVEQIFEGYNGRFPIIYSCYQS